MSHKLYYRKNFSTGRLSSAISPSDTIIIVQSGHSLPAVTGVVFMLVIWNKNVYPYPADDPNMEIVEASYSGTTNQYNIVRAQEGTTAHSHDSGDMVALHYTAGVSESDLYVLGSVLVDESSKAANRMLLYDGSVLKYVSVPGGGDMLKAVYDTDDDGVVNEAKAIKDGKFIKDFQTSYISSKTISSTSWISTGCSVTVGVTSTSDKMLCFFSGYAQDTNNDDPVNETDFQTTEFSTTEYQAIDSDDSNYVETTASTTGHAAYHVFKFKVTEFSEISEIESLDLTYVGAGIDGFNPS